MCSNSYVRQSETLGIERRYTYSGSLEGKKLYAKVREAKWRTNVQYTVLQYPGKVKLILGTRQRETSRQVDDPANGDIIFASSLRFPSMMETHA